MYALHSEHLTIDFLLKLQAGISSPDSNSPYGLIIIARGIPQSLASCALFGILSVVTLSSDLSLL